MGAFIVYLLFLLVFYFVARIIQAIFRGDGLSVILGIIFGIFIGNWFGDD